VNSTATFPSVSTELLATLILLLAFRVARHGVVCEHGNVCQYRAAGALKQISAEDGLAHRTELRRIVTGGDDKFPAPLNHGDRG